MKAYSKQTSAYAAARRHVLAYGGSAAVIETTDLPGMFQVGTMSEVRTRRTGGKVTTCKLFYGITDRRHHRGKSGAASILELNTALSTDRDGANQ